MYVCMYVYVILMVNVEIVYYTRVILYYKLQLKMKKDLGTLLTLYSSSFATSECGRRFG